MNSPNKKNVLFVAIRSLILFAFVLLPAVPQQAISTSVDAAPNEIPQAVSSPAQVFGVSVGVHLRPSTDYGNLLNTYNQQVGKDASIIMWFSDWRGWTDTGKAYNAYLANKLKSQATTRPVIMITWQPQNGQKSTGCARDYGVGKFIGYDEILKGSCDTYIRNYAREIAAREERYLIRFAHEMNIPSSSYWPGNFGLRADSYVRMYRYVHDLFMKSLKEAGGNNVEWVWSPNYASNPSDSWNLLHNYYPGDDYVDWIGLSGYNFYPRKGEPNRTFKQIYGDVDGTDAYYTSLPGVLYDLACHYAKPQILAEIAVGGTTSTAQNKINWINDAFSIIPNYPFVRAVIWFNDFGWGNNDEVDLRVTNVNPPPNLPSGITPAYRAAISPSIYKSTLPSAKAVTPPSTYCGNGTPTYQLSPLFGLVEKGSSSTYTLSGMLYGAHPSITFPDLPTGITASIINDQMAPPWGKAVIRLSVGGGVTEGTHLVKVNVDGKSFTIRLTVVRKIWSSYFSFIRR